MIFYCIIEENLLTVHVILFIKKNMIATPIYDFIYILVRDFCGQRPKTLM